VPKVALTEHPPSPLSAEKALFLAEESGQPRDASASNAEVKQLRAQLQVATEKWARDKQMFAEVCPRSLGPCNSSSEKRVRIRRLNNLD